MTLPEPFRDCLPLGVYGPTGGGKTTLLRNLVKAWPDGPTVFFNVDEEPDMGRVVQVTADDDAARNEAVRHVHELLSSGETHIDFRIPTMKMKGEEEHRALVRYLKNLGDELRRGPLDTKVLFVTDEAHEVEESAELAAKRFRKRQIKPVVATQEVQSMSRRVININRYHAWLSQPGSTETKYLKGEGFPVEDMARNPEYDALVLDSTEEYPDDHEVMPGKMRPVGRFRASEEYVVE